MIELVRLADVATFMGGGTPSRAKHHYFDGGIPWVKTTDLNNGPIYITEETLTARGFEESSCKMVPAKSVLVAMYGGFNQIGRTGILTMDSAINQALTAIIANPSKLDPLFLIEWLNFRVGYWKRFAGSSRKDPNITKGDVAAFPVPRIDIQQQKAISQILNHWNHAIVLTEKLLAEKQLLRNWLMQQLLMGKRRLLRFTQRWKDVPFGEIFKQTKIKNSDGLVDEVVSVTKGGIVRQSDYFNKDVTSADKSMYLVAERKDLVMSGLNFWMGSIDFQMITDRAIVSPAYKVFKLIDGSAHHDFMLHFVRSSYMTRILLNASVQGASIVRRNLDMSLLLESPITLPPIQEQVAIAKVLTLIAREIEFLQTKADALREQKKGLMQQLLTGKKNVTTCAT